ncbi:MAG: IgGFc-binding protein [Flavobacteriaceae bacterium]|nr:IgGFc-binding protein [Flavobacteriaceae bacterium]
MRITSTQLVSVYAFNTSVATTDATIILPVTAWGTEYYRLSYLPDLFNPDYDFEMIIAKEDDTTITFPDSSTATLNTGQVYYRLWKNDMTGRHVTSNKPTAYFTHSTLSRIFVDRNYGDILFEQMVPVNQWGKEFLVPNAPQNSNTENNHIRILAAEDGTTVSYSGATLITGIGSAASFSASGNTLNKGQWVELRINSISGVGSGSCFINAGKPIGVAAYMTGQGVQIPGYGGDPSIAWIPPLNQASPNVTISPFMFPQNATPSTPPTNLDEPSAQHYMIIITKTTTRTSTTVNGTAINSGWTDVSGYSYYRQIFNNIADLNAVFNVANPSGVIVLCGGISDRESYYYNAGSGACIIN